MSLAKPPSRVMRPATSGRVPIVTSPTASTRACSRLPLPRRYRNREHLRYVAKQPCLICGRKPSDPHHLRFLQPRALGRKASDEFAVPALPHPSSRGASRGQRASVVAGGRHRSHQGRPQAVEPHPHGRRPASLPNQRPRKPLMRIETEHCCQIGPLPIASSRHRLDRLTHAPDVLLRTAATIELFHTADRHRLCRSR